MGIFIWLFCLAFLQIVFGQVSTLTGQNTVNSGPFANGNARGLSNPQLGRDAANGMSSANQIARNAAISGNSLANAANIASANLANPNLINQNLASGNSGNANFASQHFANNIPATKLDANYANIGYADPSFTNLASSNFFNGNSARRDLTNQMYPSNIGNPITHTKIAGITENVASPYIAPNGFNSNYGNVNYADGVGGISNLNVANYISSNLGTDFGNANIASAINNLANGLNPDAVTFKIGDNPFQVISGSPGGHQLGLHVVADALKVDGTVSVTGKMPIYGTVSLDGNLPTDGMASINYGCTSQANL